MREEQGYIRSRLRYGQGHTECQGEIIRLIYHHFGNFEIAVKAKYEIFE